MFEGPLLHVGFVLLGEAQETQHAVLEGRDLELGAELLVAGMEGSGRNGDAVVSHPRGALSSLVYDSQQGGFTQSITVVYAIPYLCTITASQRGLNQCLWLGGEVTYTSSLRSQALWIQAGVRMGVPMHTAS